MTELSSTGFTLGARCKMWLLKVVCLACLTAVCAGQDDSHVTRTIQENELVTTKPQPDPPTPILQRLTKWSDVFETEELQFRCEVNGTEWTYSWYKNNEKLHEEQSLLTISSVDHTHEGQYSCKTHLKSKGVESESSNTVDVKVYTKPKPTVTRSSDYAMMYPKEPIDFTCKVDVSSEWEYVWYHNGTEISDSSSEKHTIHTIGHPDSGKYHCKAKRGSFYTEASGTINLQVSDPPTPILTLLTKWPDVFKNEELQFRCEVNGAEWTYSWYKNKEKLHEEQSLLTISSVDQTHEGQYSCKAHLKSRVDSEFSNTYDVKVYANTPKPTLTRSSSYVTMYPGESINFECKVHLSSGWDYVWYHNGKEISAPSIGTYSLAPMSHSDSGEYQCKAKRGEGQFYTDISETKSLLVSDPPTPILKLLTPWTDVFENEAVAFSCEVSSSEWTFTWYRNDEQLQRDSVLSLDATGSVLNITSVTQAHEGKYACKANLVSRNVKSAYSNTFNIDVYANTPKPTLTRSSSYVTMYPGESINFECKVHVSSGWDYVWYHNGKEISAPSIGTYSLAPMSHSDSGEYQCKAKRGEGQFYTDISETKSLLVSDPPTPILKLLTPWTDVFENEAVAFSCEVSSSEWTFTWYRNDEQLQRDSVLSLDARGSVLNITSVTQAHEGKYACKANLVSRNVKSAYSNTSNIDVYEKVPVPTLKKQSDFQPMYVGEVVSFTCRVDLSSGWSYQWYKDESELPDTAEKISIKLNRSHGGNYSCKASRGVTSTERSQTIRQDVHEIPVPSVKPLTQWLDIFPTEGVQLSCRMQGSSGWKYTWYKNAEKVQVGKTVKIENDGSRLTISSSSTSDRGKYSCFGKLEDRSVISSFSSNLTLYVYDTIPKATIVQNPKASLMHTEDWVSLSCHINVSSGWDYMWFKDESSLVSSGNTHNISSVVVSDSGSYKCQVKRGNVFKPTQSEAIAIKIEERPQAEIILQTKWLDAFATDSLALKCEVKDENSWNFTWFMENDKLEESTSERHIVTPNNDPEQHPYTCQGVRQGRPFYSKMSAPLKTKNLLLKRRILLSISGLLFFGIIAIFLGCIALKFFRKPAAENELPDENDLFLSMTKTKDSPDGPCPLVEFITEASLKASPKAVEENGEICSETTSLPIILEENQAVMTDTNNATENGCGLVSFKA
ncbi:Fc receptor-like protein 5 isoform 2-T2 [Menidia menidia]